MLWGHFYSTDLVGDLSMEIDELLETFCFLSRTTFNVVF